MAEALSNPTRLDIVLYSELTDTVPQPQRVVWDRLITALTEHDIRTEKDGPGWSATVYRERTTRGKAGVQNVTALVLDVDHAEPQWSLLDGLEYVAHTTWKHHSGDEHADCLGKPDCPHWRIVLPLLHPVQADDWEEFRARAKFWLCPNADDGAKDAPRFFWLPSCQHHATPNTRTGAGRWLDPDELRAIPPEEPRRRVISTTMAAEYSQGERPGDRYEREADWCRDIIPNWKPVAYHGDNLMVRRPGSTHPYGATINKRGQGVLYVFTDGAPPLQADTCYSKFAAYTTLYHGGDFRVAARSLAEQYGMPSRLNGHSLGRIGRRTATDDATEDASIPEIYADEQDLRIITGQAWNALVATNAADPYIFKFGDDPTRIEVNDATTPLLRPLTIDHMRYELARVADWWAMRGPKDKKLRTAQMPPLAVVRDVLATPSQPLPILDRIVSCPAFDADGQLHMANGYAERGRTYVAMPQGLQVPTVPERPTDEEIDRARALILDDLLGDFIFVTPADRANVVALGLEQFARAMIRGPLPLHNIEAPTAGTGKGLLAASVLAPSCGSMMGFLAPTTDDDEMRKRLLGTLMKGPSAIVIDNLIGQLSSGTLASVLTVPDYWDERVLGKSVVTRVPIRCSWVVTGNNPSFSDELTRRAVRTRIDARLGDPSERHGFRHDPLGEWVDAHRGDLIWAYCTLIQAWIDGGRRPFLGRKGSYENWVKVVGGVLQHVGIDGFLANQQEFREASNSELTALENFVRAWWDQFAGEHVGVKDLFNVALGIDGLDLGGGNDKAQRTRFGIFLRGQRDRIVSGSSIKQAGTRDRAQQWCLMPEEISL